VTDELSISAMRESDAGEILTIQRAAFASEAIIYADPGMPPLTQTLPELQAEIRDGEGWVARIGHRLVGAIRCRETDDLLLIGRLAIAPDMQGHGVGRALLDAAERHSRAPEAELFTGSLSEANIRLYERCGYRIAERVDNADGTEQVFMRKRLRAEAGEAEEAGEDDV
jgi:ribosomal protein S18 acetylase RimI-like enzyme